MDDLYRITLKLRKIFGREVELLQVLGQDECMGAGEAEVIRIGDGLSDEEVREEMDRLMNPSGNVRGERPVRVTFPVTVQDGWQRRTGRQAAWIVGSGDEIRAFSSVCPHLGCSVKLRESADVFECPCHDSEFGSDGAYRAGPSRRGLDELPTEIVAGELRVRWVEYVPGISERRPLGGGAT